MLILEWHSEALGYGQAIVSSQEEANLLEWALKSTFNNLQIKKLQVGNGCTGSEVR